MGTVDGLPMVKNGQASGITVCVGIPTYNRERVLVETIEQVLAQDPPADEVLVVDQTETHGPETEAYLARADEAARIRWIKHWPPNLNGARNRPARTSRSWRPWPWPRRLPRPSAMC